MIRPRHLALFALLLWMSCLPQANEGSKEQGSAGTNTARSHTALDAPFLPREEQQHKEEVPGFRWTEVYSPGSDLLVGHRLVPIHWKERPDGYGYKAPGVSAQPMEGYTSFIEHNEWGDQIRVEGGSFVVPMAPEAFVLHEMAHHMRKQGWLLTGQWRVADLEILFHRFQANFTHEARKTWLCTNLSEWQKGSARVAILIYCITTDAWPASFRYTLTRLETSAQPFDHEVSAWMTSAASLQYDSALIESIRQQTNGLTISSLLAGSWLALWNQGLQGRDRHWARTRRFP